jgi:hypothetical protein
MLGGADQAGQEGADRRGTWRNTLWDDLPLIGRGHRELKVSEPPVANQPRRDCLAGAAAWFAVGWLENHCGRRGRLRFDPGYESQWTIDRGSRRR